jgi:hypothetical protein
MNGSADGALDAPYHDKLPAAPMDTVFFAEIGLHSIEFAVNSREFTTNSTA